MDSLCPGDIIPQTFHAASQEGSGDAARLFLGWWIGPDHNMFSAYRKLPTGLLNAPSELQAQSGFARIPLWALSWHTMLGFGVRSSQSLQRFAI